MEFVAQSGEHVVAGVNQSWLEVLACGWVLEKGIVKIIGRKEVPGRPMLYGTTKEFLDHFGLSSVKDLPALSEYSLKDIEPHLLPPELKLAETLNSGGAEQKTEDDDQKAH